MSKVAKASIKQHDNQPPGFNGAIVLEDGHVFWGQGAGIEGIAIGEVCFNTSLTGYQEILTDPSYAGQIITFTFPHIGNVGTNEEDIETDTPAVRGCILRESISKSSNWRAAQHLNSWLMKNQLVGLTGVDTRRLTRHIRDNGAIRGVLIHSPEVDEKIDVKALHAMALSWPSLEGTDLAKDVSCKQTYSWNEAEWCINGGYSTQYEPKYHVVAVDFGVKKNILRCLASAGCKITVVPGNTSAEEIMGYRPDGVFLSNGPGDPAATGKYAVPMIQTIIAAEIPTFGVCLGHQMLSIAMGAKTVKMHMGHRGANHPVKDLETGSVEITSQNHGFVVDRDTLPKCITETHTSLFDGTLEGIRVEGKPAFSVQHHPEASPGPQDSHHLFQRFVDLMRGNS